MASLTKRGLMAGIAGLFAAPSIPLAAPVAAAPSAFAMLQADVQAEINRRRSLLLGLMNGEWREVESGALTDEWADFDEDIRRAA